MDGNHRQRQAAGSRFLHSPVRRRHQIRPFSLGITGDTTGTQVPSERAFGPSPPRRWNATMGVGIDAADGAADASRAGPRRSRPARRRAQRMKHIVGTTLRVGGCLVVAIAGLALLAGKDDIRKFRQMRRM